jgi:hypothetical protein
MNGYHCEARRSGPLGPDRQAAVSEVTSDTPGAPEVTSGVNERGIAFCVTSVNYSISIRDLTN